MAGSPIDSPSCAEFARTEHIDPIGTAGSYRGFAVFELPLPWPRDIGDHPSVAPVAGSLSKAGVRVQAVVPSDDGAVDRRRLAVYARPPGLFQRYRLHSVSFADQYLTEALATVAQEFESGAELPDEGPATSVVLVCSHGRRDACCGTLGTRLVTMLDGTHDAVGPNGGDRTIGTIGATVWRTSHTGGHRFAPTALVLPEGTAWAYLDDGLLAGIVERTLAVEDAASLYRGCMGLDHPAAQACEREALRTIGWSWLDHHRTGQVIAETNGSTRVRLEHTSPVGIPGAFEATVQVTRTLPIPECRQPLTQSRKTAPELAVTSFTPA